MKLKKPPLICRIKSLWYQSPSRGIWQCTLGQNWCKKCSHCKCNVRAQILEGFREGVGTTEKIIIIHKK